MKRKQIENDEKLARGHLFSSEADWRMIEEQLPEQWRQIAEQKRLIWRNAPSHIGAKITDIGQILRMVFYHVATNSSLRTTTAMASAAQMVTISAVALHKWMRKIGPYISQLLEMGLGPRPLRGLGMALYKQKRYVEAIEVLENALAIKDSQYPLNDRLLKSVEKFLESARDYVATVHVYIEPREAELWVDGKRTDKRTLVLEAGEYMVEAVFHDQRQRRYITAGMGEEQRVVIRLKNAADKGGSEAMASASDPLESSDQSVDKMADDGSPGIGTPAIVSLIAAGAGVITLSVFGPMALTEHSDLKRNGGCAPSCSDEQLSSLETYRMVADVGLGVAIAGAIVGTVFILIDNRKERTAVQVSGWLDNSDARTLVRGTF